MTNHHANFRPKPTLSLLLLAAFITLIAAANHQITAALASEAADHSLTSASLDQAYPVLFDTPVESSSRDDLQMVRVYYTEPVQLDALARLTDLHETEWNRDAQYVLLITSAAQRAQLTADGMTLVVDQAQTNDLLAFTSQASRDIPGYACYRTVEETYATGATLANDYPTLATWTDIGDSWAKTNGVGGHDIMVLKLTNSAIPGPKPGLFSMSSVHAREYTPAELATRFAEHMLANYGIDPDITWILDHTEIHLVLQANPDGRKIAEGGLLHRKNTNTNACNGGDYYFNQVFHGGVDLNRNFAYDWGGCNNENCSSSDSCFVTYRGQSAGSEPEVAAIQDYLSATFADNRDGGVGVGAPADASNVFFDMHSFSELVLWPWGSDGETGNNEAFVTFGRKLANFNDYTPQNAADLYPTDGTTIDYAYGELGMAAFVFELGTSFFQSCSVFESDVYPDNLEALIYAASVARAPYQLPDGPDVEMLSLASGSVIQGAGVALTATVDDTNFNNSNGIEPTQVISAAEYYIDTPPWQAGASAVAIAASDGSFNSNSESIMATINTTGLTVGQHHVFVRGQDVDGNWGPVSSVFLTVEQNPNAPTAVLVQQIATKAPFSWLFILSTMLTATLLTVKVARAPQRLHNRSE